MMHADEPAFPTEKDMGLTKREIIAIKLLAALTASGSAATWESDAAAAVLGADALITALNAKQP